MKPSFAVRVICVFSICLAALTTATAQDALTFRRALELAVGHSSEMALSQADEMRAYQSYLEAHNAYIPQAMVGSDVGYAYGFPLSLEGSAPTVFNVSTQSSVLNFAQREFIKAAKAEWGVSKTQTRDQRAQVILDTALVYIELNRWEERLPILRSELKVATDVIGATDERIKAGVDSPLETTKAKLAEAQVRVHIAQAEGAVDILRTRLSQLTGLPLSAVVTSRESIPVMADARPEDNVANRAIETSAAVDMAQQTAVVRQLRAKGEHKLLWYPTVDFAAQYGVINTSLTDFEKFFRAGSFQPQNITFGLVLRLPFLNTAQRSHAAAADAEALRARKEAEQVKNKTTLDAIRTQHNVQALDAARDVAQLRSELAQSQLDAAHARMQAETATQRELQNAAIDAAERSLERINADFELQRAQLQLLRTTGELENWAMPGQ
jgi:outer membrane protein TolC